MFNITSRVEQRDRLSRAHGTELYYCIGIAVKLFSVASKKLLPTLGPMIEPFAQLFAWGHVLEPYMRRLVSPY